MLIVDSQVHLWAADSPDRPWPKGTHPHRPTPLGPDEMLQEMAAGGVDRAVIVPPLWEGHRNDLAIAAARAHPDRFAIVGRLDLLAPESRGSLVALRAQPGMLGVRLSFRAFTFLRQLIEGHAEWVWGEAEAAGVPLYILVPHRQVHIIDDIARRYPGVRIVMNHLALTGLKKDEAAFRDFDQLLPIAQRPNVAVSASALPCFSTDRYPYRSLQSYLRKAYDAFGPRRFFWGTDLSRSPIPYRQHVTMFTEEIPWLTSEDKEWIMGRGLCEWLGWKLP